MTTALVALVCASAVGVMLRRRRARRGSVMDARRELAMVAVQLARGTRSGLTAIEALELCRSRLGGVVAAQLDRVVEDLRRGMSFEAAMASWHETAVAVSRIRGSADPGDVELLSVAARFAHRQGQGQPEVFESTAAALIDRAEVADEVDALTSQARASMVTLCMLPVFGATMVATVEPSVLTVLVSTPVGVASLVVAAALDALAILIGSRLVRRALR